MYIVVVWCVRVCVCVCSKLSFCFLFFVFADTDSVMVQFPHPSELVTKDDIFQYYYALCNKLAEKGTNLFPKPNVLEFETMKWPLQLYKKKNYAAHEYPGHTWKCTPHITIKGLPFKKRDRCAFVRKVGEQVVTHLLSRQISKIRPFLRDVMEQLIRNKIPYSELIITCLLQDETAYKSDNLIQLETARKIIRRTNSVFEPGSRLSYVVVEGEDLYYKRGEDPKYAEQNHIKLDMMYYLEKQFLSAILPLLEFHKEINILADITSIKQELRRKSSGICSMFSMQKKKQKTTY